MTLPNLPMRSSRTIILVVAALILSACNFSLAADVTPPPGYQPEQAVQQPQAEATAGPVFPLVPPSPSQGQAIFAEKCAACHGDTGKGDGPRAAQLPNPVAAIGSPDVARSASPAQWFGVVTRGNLDRFMPPFPSLSDRERWDVIAYSFSLSAPAESVAQGEQLYKANCAACHGENGQGDGPDAAGLSTQMVDFTNQEVMAAKSANDLFQAISQGVPPDMPAYADKLSDAQRWSLADYLRSLTFSGQALAVAPQPAATPAPGGTPLSSAVTDTITSTQPITAGQAVSPTAAIGDVTGKVINESGGELPKDMTVLLHGFDQMQVALTQTVPLAPDGSYVFKDVPMPAGRMFLTTVEFSGATYGSEIGTVQAGSTALDLPISVYATTSDTSKLVIDRLHLFFEQTDAGAMRVIELYVISNNGKETVVAPEEGKPAVTFNLPEGATGLEFQDGALGDRYVETDGGFGDTIPIRPGQGSYQVLFAFNMPYDRKLDLVQKMSMPADAVVVLVPENVVKVKGEALEDAGTRPVQDATYHMYNSQPLKAGEELKLTVTAGSGSVVSGASTSLLVGAGALGLALIVAGVWLYRRNQAAPVDEEDLDEGLPAPASPAGENAETVMDAILALDDLYKDGQLPEDAYLQRRAELKARLKELME